MCGGSERVFSQLREREYDSELEDIKKKGGNKEGDKREAYDFPTFSERKHCLQSLEMSSLGLMQLTFPKIGLYML